MAIFGDLSDLPFPEIFNMIGRRNGRLVVSDLPCEEIFELELAEGSLRGLRVKGGQIEDTLVVRDRLTALMEASRGAFVFHRCAAEELRGSLNLSITSLLLAVASAVDEMSAYQDRFAHPSTRFKRMAGDEVWLDEELYQFSECAAQLLLRGTDAEELSRELHLSVEKVQLNLYKLRSVGWIAPVRAFEDRSPAPAPAPEPAPAAPAEALPPLRRGRETLSGLLRSLRSRIGLLWEQAGN